VAASRRLIRMPLFHYKAAAADGRVFEGEMEAQARDAVVRRLQSEGQVPIRVDERGAVVQRSGGGLSLLRRRGAGAADVQAFTTELSTLLQAGLPLDRVLELLETLATEGSGMRKVLTELQSQVRGGADLSAALAEHPRLFSPFYVNMVRAGEASGQLEAATARLAEFLERSRAVQSAVINALIYPAILLAVAIMSLSLILAVVVPRISEMFAQAGESLPWYTQLVVGAGALVEQYWWVMLSLVVGAALWLRRDYASARGRARWDAFVLRLPIVGTLVEKVEAGRFARSMGTMLHSGVPLLDAVAISGAIISNTRIAGGVERVAGSIREGEGVAGPLLREGVLPELAGKLIRVGEESGRLEEMMLKVADIYEHEVDNGIRRMVSVLAPALVLLLAAVIMGIMVSLVVPIITLNQLAL
jgi:general secretion pathway protein F